MGVEGKDRAKVLEAGAASLSNQLGLAVQRLRKSFGLSLADLSSRSGVAKSIISQIERNETNPTLTTIWRLAHALDVSIVSMLQGGEDGPFIEHLKRGTTPIFVSDDGLCRLAVTGWLKTVDWLQWYDFQADPGGVLESSAHARGSVECLSVLDGELEVELHIDAAVGLAPDEQIEVFRIVQEGLVNIRKHSGARHALVRLSSSPTHWILTMEDDGKGFNFSGKFSLEELDQMGKGPQIIKERVRLIGGTLTVESNPGAGTRLEIKVPKGGEVSDEL